MAVVRSLGTAADAKVVESRKSISVPVADLLVDGKLEVYPEVERLGYFTISFKGTELQLTAGPYVGLIPVNTRLTIEVRPKLPVNNLARILEVSQLSLGFLKDAHRLYPTEPAATVSVVEFLARNLLASMRDIELHGMHKTYLPKMNNSNHPRGRINFRKTALLNRSRGISHKVFGTSFEQTVDTPYNRLLKYALWFLAQRLTRSARRGDKGLMRDLNRTLALFESVNLGPSRQLVEEVRANVDAHRLPSSRQYYERPLKMALAVLAGKGISLSGHGEEIELSSYIMNFDDLFEAYFREVLRERMAARDSKIRVRNGNEEAKRRLFNERKVPPAQPDIVMDIATDRVLLAEVKYKERPDRADINQVVTYACSYSVNTVVLAHACESAQASGRVQLGTIGAVRVFDYAFHMANPDLDSEEQAFANSMYQLLTTLPSTVPVASTPS